MGIRLHPPEKVRDLFNCLADEAPARPETIRKALRRLLPFGAPLYRLPLHLLARGRYGTDLREEVGRAFLGGSKVGDYAETLSKVVFLQTIEADDAASFARAATRFNELLRGPEMVARCEGALGFKRLCELLQDDVAKQVACAEAMRPSGAALIPMLFSEAVSEQYASAWALAGLGVCRAWTPPAEPDLLGRLFTLWRRSPAAEVRGIAVRALVKQPLAPRDNGRCASIPRAESRDLLQGYPELDEWWEKPAALVLAWYLRGLSDGEIAKLIRQLFEKVGPGRDATVSELLEHLGETP